MSDHFLNGFIDELVKEGEPAPALPKPPGQTMEVKAPTPPKPPKPLTPQKPQTMELPGVKTANPNPKMISLFPGLKRQLKRMMGSDKVVKAKAKVGDMAAKARLQGAKAKGTAQDLAGRARAFASKQGAKWEALSPAEKKRYLAAAGAGAAVAAGAVKLSAEDKAGSMVKEVVENAKGKARPERDVAMGMDQYGGGLGNFEGKTAPKFTDKVNPTDTPQAF